MLSSIVFGVLALAFATVLTISVVREKFKIEMSHAIWGGITAFLVIATFTPISKLSLGTNGIEADLEAKKATILETVMNSSPQMQNELEVLRRARGGWVDVQTPPKVQTSSKSARTRISHRPRVVTSAKITPPPTEKSEAPPTEKSEVQPSVVEKLEDKGVVETREGPKGNTQMRVTPQWMQAVP